MNKIKTQGIHHLGLTVLNLKKTLAFFVDTLGFKQVGENPDYPAAYVSDDVTMITFWQTQDQKNSVSFDRKNTIGLHHFALKMGSLQDLHELYELLKQTEGVSIEFAPEPLGTGPTMHMMCTEPGGIRIEFIAAA